MWSLKTTDLMTISMMNLMMKFHDEFDVHDLAYSGGGDRS